MLYIAIPWQYTNTIGSTWSDAVPTYSTAADGEVHRYSQERRLDQLAATTAAMSRCVRVYSRAGYQYVDKKLRLLDRSIPGPTLQQRLSPETLFEDICQLPKIHASGTIEWTGTNTNIHTWTYNCNMTLYILCDLTLWCDTFSLYGHIIMSEGRITDSVIWPSDVINLHCMVIWVCLRVESQTLWFDPRMW